MFRFVYLFLRSALEMIGGCPGSVFIPAVLANVEPDVYWRRGMASFTLRRGMASLPCAVEWRLYLAPWNGVFYLAPWNGDFYLGLVCREKYNQEVISLTVCTSLINWGSSRYFLTED